MTDLAAKIQQFFGMAKFFAENLKVENVKQHTKLESNIYFLQITKRQAVKRRKKV